MRKTGSALIYVSKTFDMMRKSRLGLLRRKVCSGKEWKTWEFGWGALTSFEPGLTVAMDMRTAKPGCS